MKYIFAFILGFLSVSFVISEEDCQGGGVYEPNFNSCTFRCTPNGVIFDCNHKTCRCQGDDTYYNPDTKSCSKVNCDNMDCAGRENEKFFSGCESGSRDRCRCSIAITMDCRRGCMCKNGFCRQNDKCVPRDCEHPVYH